MANQEGKKKDKVKYAEKIKFSDRLWEIIHGEFNEKLIAKGILDRSMAKEDGYSNQELMNFIHRMKGVGGSSKTTVGNWIDGKSLPMVEVIVAMAKTLDVSVDYLLGLDEEKTKEKQEQYIPFKEIGISDGTWNILNKYSDKVKQELLEINKDVEGYQLPDDFMLEDSNMSVLNTIIGCNNVGEDGIPFPILDGLYTYLDFYSQQPFYRIGINGLDSFNDVFYATNSMLFDSEFSKPYTTEEIEEYILAHNSFCSEDERIDIATFKPEEDEKCDYFIKSKRISKGTINHIKGSSYNMGCSTIEDIETNAFYQLKLRLSKLKVEKIKEKIVELDKFIKQYEESLVELDIEKDENINAELRKAKIELERLNKLVIYYERG